MRISGKIKSAGFTLVELLVVIGIIAVLISILLPSLSRARQEAQQTQCASNLRQFGISDAEYTNENPGWHMPAFWGSQNYNRCWSGLLPFRRTLSMPVLNPQDATYGGDDDWCYIPPKWFCPKALRGATQYPVNYPGPPLIQTVLVPVIYSYGMNVEGIDDGTGPATAPSGASTSPEQSAYPEYDPADFPQCSMTPRGSATDLDTRYESSSANYRAHFPFPVGSVHAFRTSQVKHPSDKIFIADAIGSAINENGAGLTLFPFENYDNIGESNKASAVRTTAWRHLGKANVLYFDGHVDALRHDQLANRDPATGNWVGNDRLWKVNQ